MTREEYAKVFRQIPEPTAKPLWVRDYKAISTHIRGNKENDLISKRRPNEPAEVNDYRKENYRAVTRHPFNQAITNLVRIMHNSGVEVKFPEDIQAELIDTNFNGRSFLHFFESEIIRKMIEAANAFLVWWPENVGDETQRITLKPIVVEPERIHHLTGDVFCFLSDEKSEVLFNNKKVKEGKVYYYITKTEIGKRIQTGKKNEDNYFFETYYSNPTGLLYPLCLGGDVTSDRPNEKSEDIEFFTSFFSSAVPFADECISQFSDHQGVLVNTSFPLREVEQMNCTNEGCTNGYLNDAEKGRIICGVCKGTGKLPMSPSPYGVLIRPSRKANINGDQNVSDSVPVMRFIHPDVSILEYGGKVWKEHLQSTKDALNLLFVEESQSGIAKEVDREDKVATLDKIGRHLYGFLIKNSIQIYYKFMFPEREWPQVHILMPSTFVPKTQTQIEAEVKSFREMSVPDVILAPKMREMMRKSVNGDPFEMKIYDISTIMDPVYLRTFNEKNQMMATDVIDAQTLKRSGMIPGVLRTYANETPEFMDQEVETIIAEVDARIDALLNDQDPS